MQVKRARVWLVARRRILTGEEVCFSYGQVFNDMFGRGAADKNQVTDWHKDNRVYSRTGS